MKWEDLKDSTELAEALGLAASLVAAVMALRDARREEEEEAKDDPSKHVDVTANVQVEALVPKRNVTGFQLSVFLKEHSNALLFGVVCFQFMFILFIAYRLM